MFKAKKKRLFIAINLPEEIKDKIEAALEKIKYLFIDEVRFIDRQQWHITMTFLGYESDEVLPAIIKSMIKATGNFLEQEIRFTDLDYGPKGGSKRMIWLNGDDRTSGSLSKLKERLEDALIDNGVAFKRERRKFQVHITLARFQTRKNLPEIFTPLALEFRAKSLDLMESYLKHSGAEYELLQQSKFNL